MSGRGLGPPLADVLGVLLPDPMDTLLLRACVGDATSVASAWQGWLTATGGLPKALTDRPASRALIPLLYHSLREHGVAVAEPSLAILRSAHLWEARRAAEIRAILRQVIAALCASGIHAMTIEGAAAATIAYPAFELRHCHDIALLVEEAELVRSRDLLTGIGFSSVADQQSGTIRLLHKGGLPVVLRTALWAPTRAADPAADFRRRAIIAKLDSADLAVFQPIDMLLHVCGQGLEPAEPGNWGWVADAAMILRRVDAKFGWTALVQMAKDHGLAFRLSLRFGYLASCLNLAIPFAVADELAVAAWQGERREWERALSVARGAFGLGLGAMLRQGGWHSKLAVAKWALRRSPRLIGMRALP